MSSSEREESDRDPAVARKTTRPCAIEDGEEKTTVWERWAARLSLRRRWMEPPAIIPVEPETLPEPPPAGNLPEETE